VSPAPAHALPTPLPRVGTLILGVDPGSRATGYGLLRLEGSRIRYERSGTIVTRSSIPFPDRLLHVHDALAGLLAEIDPDEVAVESAFVRPNSKSALAALQIGHVRGVVLLAARRSRASIFEYTAPEVKLAVVRQGAAAKEQVMFMVRRLLPGIDRVSEDEADALAVALCHAHRAPARSLSILPAVRPKPPRHRSDR
jgi:crossover junction endodeoxyribonuclease RuvC